jgi:hypothetical protein
MTYDTSMGHFMWYCVACNELLSDWRSVNSYLIGALHGSTTAFCWTSAKKFVLIEFKNALAAWAWGLATALVRV